MLSSASSEQHLINEPHRSSNKSKTTGRTRKKRGGERAGGVEDAEKVYGVYIKKKKKKKIVCVCVCECVFVESAGPMAQNSQKEKKKRMPEVSDAKL